MRFKSRKTAVLAVLALLLMVQLVFSGVNSSNKTSVAEEETAKKQYQAAAPTEVAVDDKTTDGITDEEVVSANLNVVYRSSLTSTEVVDDFDGNIDKGDFNNKIVSYTCDELNVYAAADNKSDVVGVMYSGSEADIVEKGAEWTKVTSGDVTGYIRNVDVLFGDEAETIAQAIGSKVATVTTDTLPVYSDPDASSQTTTTLQNGSQVKALEEKNGFLLVSSDSGYGYIAKDSVKITYGLRKALTKAEIQEQEAKAAAAAAQKAAEEAAAKATQAAQNNYSSVSTASRAAYNASADEIHLLAAIVYWESGWEPAEGQLAVANVVLNRVLSPRFTQKSITDVIYAPGQFSGVVENGAPSARFQAVLNMSNDELNRRGCYDAALTALSGKNNIGGLLFFISVRKAVYANYSNYTIINNHCFYTY